MAEVYLAGRGLASTLGPSLDAALDTLRHGTLPAPTLVHAAPGASWPVHLLSAPDTPWSDAAWMASAERVIRRVAAESEAPLAREGPLYIASSSLDVGEREINNRFTGDCHTFSETIATWLDWRGPVFTVSTACTSALNALHSAASHVRAGHADDALVLGLELPNRYTVAGFAAMQLLAPERAQPFGAARQGLVLGQAVAALRLSRRPSPWRLCGESNVVDGSDPAGTVASAIVAMCEQVLARCQLRPQDIDLIKPQAAGGRGSDAIEAAALQQVFGTLPPWVSLKALLGHTLGAAGAAEIALLTACLDAGLWPEQNYPLDPALELAPSAAPTRPWRHLLASIIGFGGGHAAAVLARSA